MLHLNAFYPWIAGFFALIAAPPIVAIGSWARRRGLRRNQRGQCARCGQELRRHDEEAEFLIEGLAVCGPCAEGFRRRLLWIAPAILASAVTALAWAGIWLWPYITTDRGIDAVSVLGVLAPGAGLLWAAQRARNRMRLANEAARLRVGVLATLIPAAVAELIVRAPKVNSQEAAP